MPTNAPPPPPTMQPTPPASPDTTPAPTTPNPLFTTTPAPTTTTMLPSTTPLPPTTTTPPPTTTMMAMTTTPAFTTTVFSFGNAMQTTQMMAPAFFLASRTRAASFALLQQPVRRPGGAVPHHSYTPVDHCNCPCSDPHTEALLTAERNALREAKPVSIYFDDTATSPAWGVQAPPQPLPVARPMPPATHFSAAVVTSQITRGGARLQSSAGAWEDSTDEQQTATLRKMLQSWGAQSQQAVAGAFAPPPPTISPSVFGSVASIGAADVDESSFGL